MIGALEEYVEDAFVSYLSEKVNGLTISAAWTTDAIKYPCVIVSAGSSDNVGGTGLTGIRKIAVNVAVMVEASDTSTSTARGENLAIRARVIDALAIADLAGELNNVVDTKANFSKATITKIDRSIIGDRRGFLSEITLDCIASRNTSEEEDEEEAGENGDGDDEDEQDGQ